MSAYTVMQFNDQQADDDVIRQSVFNAYNVMSDDARLRKITELVPGDRGEYFDSLRKDYPVRREFSNFVVIVSEIRERLCRSLTGLGFHVDTASQQLTR